MIAIVEGIVRPQDPSQREAALVDAARSLAAAKPDLYKCEVPFAGKADAVGDVVFRKTRCVSPQLERFSH